MPMREFDRLLTTGKDLSESVRRYDQEIVLRLSIMAILVTLSFVALVVTANYVDALLAAAQMPGNTLWLFFSLGLGVVLLGTILVLSINYRRLGQIQTYRRLEQAQLENLKIMLNEYLSGVVGKDGEVAETELSRARIELARL